jgi:hypothetical protein
MRSHTFKHFSVVDRGDEQVELTCEIEYCPLVRGSTDGRCGPKLEPDEPEHCELVDWTPAIDLTDAERRRIEDEGMEGFYSRRADDHWEDRDD